MKWKKKEFRLLLFAGIREMLRTPLKKLPERTDRKRLLIIGPNLNSPFPRCARETRIEEKVCFFDCYPLLISFSFIFLYRIKLLKDEITKYDLN